MIHLMHSINTMTNRLFFYRCIWQPKENRSHASLEYKDRTFYSYDDRIGKVHGNDISICDAPASATLKIAFEF